MRTDDEVTAAAERTADLALRCVRLTAERDRARDIAVALEGQVAAVRALAEEWATEGESLVDHAYSGRDVHEGSLLEKCAAYLRAALDPDPADRGTGDGGGS